jgi:hypothetical protein
MSIDHIVKQNILSSDQELVRKVLEASRSSLRQTELSDHDFFELAQKAGTIENFQIIFRYIYEYSKTHPDPSKAIKKLFRFVDESIYDLGEWLAALISFHHWLKNENKKADFEVMIGYLQCCSESPENKDIKHELSDLLKIMLDAHGFKGAR